MSGSVRDIIHSSLSRPSIFRAKDTLYPDYVPEKLPHREEQLKELVYHFRSILESPGRISQQVLIVGPIGVGKTATAKKFAEEFTSYATTELGINMRYVYINCHSTRSLYNVALEIARQLQVPIPMRGYSAREVFERILEKLEDRDQHVIIILDEFDYFIDVSGPDAVYFLVRLYDEFPMYKRRINYIFIMRDLTTSIGKLDRATGSYIIRNVIKFEPYTVAQLEDILRYRVELAFHPGTVSDDVISYIAELIGVDGQGDRSGNARKALEILLLAGEYADREGSTRVTIEHVRKAYGMVSSDSVILLQDAIQGGQLTLHQLLLLLAIIRVLKNKETEPYARMGEVEQEYRSICEEFGEKPRGHTQVYEYIRDMERKGIIEAKLSGKGMRGRTTLISLGTAPLDRLEKLVLEAIKRYKGEV